MINRELCTGNGQDQNEVTHTSILMTCPCMYVPTGCMKDLKQSTVKL